MKPKEILPVFWGAVAAGLMIGIGGTVFLAAPDKVTGAVLFSVGLLTICTYGLRLFTGAVGYLLTDRGTAGGRRLVTGVAVWLGNLVGTGVYGALLGLAKPALREKAAALCVGKLALPLPSTFFLAVCCGLLMYLAVDIFKTRQGFFQLIGIFVAVPVFILAGFEHSIADMAYFAIGYGSPLPTVQALVFLLVVTAGNSLGAVLLPLFSVLSVGKKD